jgi:hypothetical protein
MLLLLLTNSLNLTRPSLNAVYNVTERINVDLGIHYIVHKLTKLELNQMNGNNSNTTTNNSTNNNNNINNDEMKRDEAFSKQVKYYVIKVLRFLVL